MFVLYYAGTAGATCKAVLGSTIMLRKCPKQQTPSDSTQPNDLLIKVSYNIARELRRNVAITPTYKSKCGVIRDLNMPAASAFAGVVNLSRPTHAELL